MPLPASALLATFLLAAPAGAGAQEATLAQPPMSEATAPSLSAAPAAMPALPALDEPMAPPVEAQPNPPVSSTVGLPSAPALAPQIAPPVLSVATDQQKPVVQTNTVDKSVPSPQIAATPAAKKDAPGPQRTAQMEAAKDAQPVTASATAVNKTAAMPQSDLAREASITASSPPMRADASASTDQSSPPVPSDQINDATGSAILLGLGGAGVLLLGAGAVLALGHRRKGGAAQSDGEVVERAVPQKPDSASLARAYADHNQSTTGFARFAAVAMPVTHADGRRAEQLSRARDSSSPDVSSLERMVSAVPDADNPFLTRRNRIRRANFLISHGGTMPARRPELAPQWAASPASVAAPSNNESLGHVGAGTRTESDRRQSWPVRFNPAPQPG